MFDQIKFNVIENGLLILCNTIYVGIAWHNDTFTYFDKCNEDYEEMNFYELFSHKCN